MAEQKDRKGDLVEVVNFFILPGEPRMDFGKKVKDELSADALRSLANEIRIARGEEPFA